MAVQQTSDVSDTVQDYAKAIYSLHGRSGEAVSTSAIAERLVEGRGQRHLQAFRSRHEPARLVAPCRGRLD